MSNRIIGDIKSMMRIILDTIEIKNINPIFELPISTLFIIGSILVAITIYLVAWYIFKMRSATTHKNLISAFTFLMIPSLVFLFLGIALLGRGISEFKNNVPNYYIPLKLSTAFLVPWLVLFVTAIVCIIFYRKKR